MYLWAHICGRVTQNGMTGNLIAVCSTVDDGPKWKLAFRYPVSQFSGDCHEILQPLLSSHLATTLKISRNSIEYFKS